MLDLSEIHETIKGVVRNVTALAEITIESDPATHKRCMALLDKITNALILLRMDVSEMSSPYIRSPTDITETAKVFEEISEEYSQIFSKYR